MSKYKEILVLIEKKGTYLSPDLNAFSICQDDIKDLVESIEAWHTSKMKAVLERVKSTAFVGMIQEEVIDEELERIKVEK